MKNQRPGQSAVRKHQLAQVFRGHDAEIGQKMALTLAKFHEGYVEPLERRLLVLETIFGIRLMRWVWSGITRAWTAVRSRIVRLDDEPEGEEDE